jgi:hypothetical protein
MGRALSEVRIVPGFDREMTPTLAQANIVDGAFVRWREGLFEKIGGWMRWWPVSMSGRAGIARAIWGWQDVNQTSRLAYGGFSLQVLTPSLGTITDVTPQVSTVDSPINNSTSGITFATTSGSNLVTIVDHMANGPSINNSVDIQTPVAIGGIVLFGLYPINTVVSSISYTILAAKPATSSATVAQLMTFTTSSGQALVHCVLPNHGLVAGQTIAMRVPTSVGGIIITGTYLAQPPIDATSFNILSATIPTGSATAVQQNNGNVRLSYYVALGPQGGGAAWGTGTWGSGLWGTGLASPVGAGTPITATDWSLFNWGEILIANPAGGGIYQWGPESSLTTGQLLGAGPVVADGCFLATPEQIIIAWGVASGQNTQTGSSGTITQIGVVNPLRIVWCDAGNFYNWAASASSFAGGFNLSSGSRIIAGIQAANQFLLLTDLGVWSGTFVGQPLVFSIVEVMQGCGLINSRKAVGKFGTTVYWMSQNQFFQMAAGGVPQVLPCTVWDKVFQNLTTDPSFIQHIRFFANDAFNEIGWYFPSKASMSGENDIYVKYDTVQGLWDYGPMGRSAWIGQSVLGPPIGVSNGTNSEPVAIIYQHELGTDADGAPINWFIRTGDAVIGTGDEFQFLDYVIPDFRYGKEGQTANSQAAITIFAKGFPSDGLPGNNPIVPQGPYVVSQSSPFFEPRLRGRTMSMLIQGSDISSFVRGGLIRYRNAPDGRNP